MENWTRFNLMGQQVKKIMKKGVVPHRFACQKDRKRAASPVPREAFLKRQRMQILKEIQESTISAVSKPPSDAEINTPESLPLISITENAVPSTSGSTVAHVAIQVNRRPHMRSKYTQVKASTSNTASSPLKVIKVNVSTSPKSFTKLNRSRHSQIERLIELVSDNTSGTESTEIYEPETSTVSESDIQCQLELLKASSASRTVEFIKINPRHYIGVPLECYFFTELLSKESKININNILLILKKIRLNNSFVELADDFGISTSQASKIFSKYVPAIAQYLRSFIFWPKPETIIKNLPIAFRARYSKVQSIIDALEIEIEKPSDPVKQSLSWSEYKQCNTIKYLISATPDGIINYISPGFSGRISDTLLTEQSGYLDILPNGAFIMADRGFKHIEHLLNAKGCKLIRPPSVESNRKLAKAEVLETKRIASLRIHIERVIRRIREFKFLRPHSCINNKLISLTDDIITTAAALVNLQGPLVKK